MNRGSNPKKSLPFLASPSMLTARTKFHQEMFRMCPSSHFLVFDVLTPPQGPKGRGPKLSCSHTFLQSDDYNYQVWSTSAQRFRRRWRDGQQIDNIPHLFFKKRAGNTKQWLQHITPEHIRKQWGDSEIAVIWVMRCCLEWLGWLYCKDAWPSHNKGEPV